MNKLLFIVISLFYFSCKTTTFFVVRHAEKETTATMTNDVPLSLQGKERAEALKDLLLKKNIRFIYATNYIRTKSTAQPLAETIKIPVQIYDVHDTSFVSKIKNSKAGNVLIVGHSNTVDDIVNQLEGKTVIPADLPDSQYGDLFVVKKRGHHFLFEKKHFGR